MDDSTPTQRDRDRDSSTKTRSDPAHDLDLGSVDTALRTTRSVRRRIDFTRAVEPELIEECIEVAIQAPTGIDAESWRFIVVTDPEKKHALATLYRAALGRLVEARGNDVKSTQHALADRLHEIPAIVVVCSIGKPLANSNAMQVAFYGSVLPAAWSFMVALRARGVGATWTTLHLLREDESARILGIPEGVTQTVLLPIGHMDGAVLRPATRKPAAEVTYWNGWGLPRD
jgi:nitroreductase